MYSLESGTDQLWWVGSLWVLVGLAATVIATWVGGNLRDEFSRSRKPKK